MAKIVNRALYVYGLFFNFYNWINNMVLKINHKLTITAYNNNVFYKAYISPKHGYKTIYDYDNILMKLLILLFKCLYIDGFFMMEHIVLKTINNPEYVHVVGYVVNGRIHYEIVMPFQKTLSETEYNPVPEQEKKKLLYVFLNAKYDVTREFNVLYNSIAKNNLMGRDLMDILFNMKYRGKMKPATFLYKLGICYDDGEFNEQVFKTMDIFTITS